MSRNAAEANHSDQFWLRWQLALFAFSSLQPSNRAAHGRNLVNDGELQAYLQVTPPGVCGCRVRTGQKAVTLGLHGGQKRPRAPKTAPEEKDVVQLFNSDSKRVTLFQWFQQTDFVNVMQA